MVGDHGRACDSALRRVDRVLALCAEGDSRPFANHFHSRFLGSKQGSAGGGPLEPFPFEVPLSFYGDKYKINGTFDGLSASDVKLEHDGKTYNMIDNGGFNEWVYLYHLPEFLETTKQYYPTFLLDNWIHRDIMVDENKNHVNILVLGLTVNHVSSSPSAGGFYVRRAHYELVFLLP